MNLLLPLPKGWNTAVGSYAQIIGGLLYALAELVRMIGLCVSGESPLDTCFNSFPTLIMGVVVAANGLSQIGLGAKVEDVKADTKSIKTTGESTEKTVEAI